MKINYIYTKRNFESAFYWGIVFEWEDNIAKALNLSLFREYDAIYMYRCLKYKTIRRINKFLPFARYFIFPSKLGLKFDMSPVLRRQRPNMEHIIPWIIDFFLRESELPQLNSFYRKCPMVLISSKEAYDFIISNKALCPDCNFYHMALSLPDKYKITALTKFDKRYDVVMVGRQNPYLENWFYEYIKIHPQISYVYRKQICEDVFEYYANTGECLGVIKTRDDYMHLLRSGRIALYTTPDIDTDHKRAHGYNQVTPRFLEFIASGMHVIARYETNPDTEYYRLQDFSPIITSYEEFEMAMDYALTYEVDMKKYANYLMQHYTSVRAEQIKEILRKL